MQRENPLLVPDWPPIMDNFAAVILVIHHKKTYLIALSDVEQLSFIMTEHVKKELWSKYTNQFYQSEYLNFLTSLIFFHVLFSGLMTLRMTWRTTAGQQVSRSS